jgi:hypothetical protein
MSAIGAKNTELDIALNGKWLHAMRDCQETDVRSSTTDKCPVQTHVLPIRTFLKRAALYPLPSPAVLQLIDMIAEESAKAKGLSDVDELLNMTGGSMANSSQTPVNHSPHVQMLREMANEEEEDDGIWDFSSLVEHLATVFGWDPQKHFDGDTDEATTWLSDFLEPLNERHFSIASSPGIWYRHC